MCDKLHDTIMYNTNFTSHPQDTTLSKVPYIKADASIVSGYGIIYLTSGREAQSEFVCEFRLNAREARFEFVCEEWCFEK